MKKAERIRIVTELEKSFVAARAVQAPRRRRWRKLEAYLKGLQIADEHGVLHGHEWAKGKSADGNVDKEYWIVNEVRRIHLSNMQRLTSYSIKPEVVPQNKDNDNKVAARLGKIFLADLVRRQDEERMKAAIAYYLSLHGCSFMKVGFDPSLGQVISAPRRGMVGKVMAWFLAKDSQRKTGDIYLDVVSPWNILLPPNTSVPEKADGIIHHTLETVDSLYRKFKVTVRPEQVEPDDFGLVDGKPRGEDGEAAGNHDNQVILKEKQIRPCPRYPKGAIFAWANGELLKCDELTPNYPDIGIFSASMMFDDQTPFSDSALWDLLPEQDILNEAASFVHRWLAMTALLKRWIP